MATGNSQSVNARIRRLHAFSSHCGVCTLHGVGVATLEMGSIDEKGNCSIITTSDGGASWQTRFTATEGLGCMLGGSVRMPSSDEIWISGGTLTNAQFEGYVRAKRSHTRPSCRRPERPSCTSLCMLP